jgi:hypothetical protein
MCTRTEELLQVERFKNEEAKNIRLYNVRAFAALVLTKVAFSECTISQLLAARCTQMEFRGFSRARLRLFEWEEAGEMALVDGQAKAVDSDERLLESDVTFAGAHQGHPRPPP